MRWIAGIYLGIFLFVALPAQAGWILQQKQLHREGSRTIPIVLKQYFEGDRFRVETFLEKSPEPAFVSLGGPDEMLVCNLKDTLRTCVESPPSSEFATDVLHQLRLKGAARVHYVVFEARPMKRTKQVAGRACDLVQVRAKVAGILPGNGSITHTSRGEVCMFRALQQFPAQMSEKEAAEYEQFVKEAFVDAAVAKRLRAFYEMGTPVNYVKKEKLVIRIPGSPDVVQVTQTLLDTVTIEKKVLAPQLFEIPKGYRKENPLKPKEGSKPLLSA